MTGMSDSWQQQLRRAWRQVPRHTAYMVCIVRSPSILLAVLMLVMCTALLVPSLGLSGSARAATPAAAGNSAVTTYKGDLARDGNFANETQLTTSNVNAAQFGKLASYPVDGQVYAEPLYVPGVATTSGTFDLVFVATENDSVYAFDAQHQVASPIWHTSFLSAGVTAVPNADVFATGHTEIYPIIGITSTPVIDASTNTIYVLAFTKESGGDIYRLHALDLTTGLDKVAPVVISATVAGTGVDSAGGTVTFTATNELQRAALLLLNHVVYLGFASFGDKDPYHGWILGYDASTLARTTVFNVTPDGTRGGIWQSGGGFAADPATGDFFVQIGNGDFTANTGGRDIGDAIIKFGTTGGLKVLDYFTPFNQSCLDTQDLDLGSGGVIILPTQAGAAHPDLVLGGGKEGRIYLADQTNLGQYTPIAHACQVQNLTNVDHVVQESPPATVGKLFSTPAYWNGTVYEQGLADRMKAFTLTNGLLNLTPASQTNERFGAPSGNPVVSSAGTTAGTGIVWSLSPSATCTDLSQCLPSNIATLRAYDATNLSHLLYSSSQNQVRDGLTNFVKFSVPTIANGEVFVGTANSLAIFGLLPGNPPPPTVTPTISATATPVTGAPYNNIGISDDANPTVASFDIFGDSYSAQALQKVGVTPGAPLTVDGITYTWPSVAAGDFDNYRVKGQTLLVPNATGATTIGFLGSSSGGPATGTATLNFTDGTTLSVSLSFSDWTLNNGKSPVTPGNTIAFTAAYRNTPTRQNAMKVMAFGATFAIPAGKTVQSVTLPTLITQGTLSVFAVATNGSVGGTPTPTPVPTNTPVPTATPTNTPAPTPTATGTPVVGAYNNIGITDDGNTTPGNYDGHNSYSAQALQAAGLTPGGTITINGVTFTWPNVPSGKKDDYQNAGQVIAVTPVAGATTLAFLGSATGGPSQGTATITYTDGTTQTFTLSLSDWTLNGGHSAPVAGDSIAATMAYRNTPTGQQTTTTYLFYAEVALQSGKTVRSITLPTTVNQGRAHIFAIGTK